MKNWPLSETAGALSCPNRYSTPETAICLSGLKTAVRKIIESYSPDGILEHAILPEQDVADICAGFQFTVTECLCQKLEKAIAYFKQHYPEGKDLVVSGGVAANTFLRTRLELLAQARGMEFSAPPIRFCTDNGVMIAWAGLERFQNGYTNELDFKPRPRWPLDENAPKAAGAGGVKA